MGGLQYSVRLMFSQFIPDDLRDMGRPQQRISVIFAPLALLLATRECRNACQRLYIYI